MITKARAYELRKIIEQASASLSDETALESIELFPNWADATPYAIGDRVRYTDTLYKCVQAHTSQSDWTPNLTPALWVKISLDEYPEWVQPTGAHDAYNKGDKVSHNNKHWSSDVDANVWEPPTMWSEV